eukprot:2007754-Rhodomonas_salina.1
MIEPEIAFADLYDTMRCAEDYVRYCCKCVLEECMDDLELLSKMYDKGCIARVQGVVAEPFARCRSGPRSVGMAQRCQGESELWQCWVCLAKGQRWRGGGKKKGKGGEEIGQWVGLGSEDGG